MRVLCVLLVLATLLASTPAWAEETPRQAHSAEIRRIRDLTDCVTKKVVGALRKQDWYAWCSAHTNYSNALARAITEIEAATTRLLFDTLNSGGALDGRVQASVNDGANLAALLAKRRLVTNAYASLTRQGIRPDRRANALALLDRQGIYGNPGTTTCDGAGRPQITAETGANASPLSGRVPGSQEAAEHLRKWQYAWLRASSLRQNLDSKEAEFEALSLHAPSREEAQQELSEMQLEYEQLENAVVEWRTKYFEAGGR